ncbi:hypothetical protein D3C86_1868230 [compost metagenome]
MEVGDRRTDLHDQRFSLVDVFFLLAVGWQAQVVQRHRNHLGWRIQQADAAGLQLGGVFRLEDQVPGIDRCVGT